MSRSGGATTRTWWFVVLAVLVVADVALIAAAVASTRPGEQREAGPIPTFSSGPPPEEQQTSSPTASPTTSPTSTEPSGFLSVVSATEAWRATPGSCTDVAARVERSIDGGATWSAVELSFDVRTVVALEAGSQRVSVLGGVGTACDRQFWASFTGGEFWKEYPAEAGSLGFTDVDGSTVTLRSGTVSSPCASPIRVVSSDGGDAVACEGLVTFRDAAGTWTPLDMPGVIDVTVSDDRYLIARSGADDCAGLAVQSVSIPVTSRSFASPLGCIPDIDPAGDVSLSSSGQVVWADAGSQTLVSTDGGATW